MSVENAQFKKCTTCNRRVLRSTGNDQCTTCRGRKYKRQARDSKEVVENRRARERRRVAAAGVPSGWAV